MAGFELEALEPAAPAFSGVVVAEILTGGAAPASRQAARLPRVDGAGRAAADRLRRVQCARRIEERAGGGGREAAGRV